MKDKITPIHLLEIDHGNAMDGPDAIDRLCRPSRGWEPLLFNDLTKGNCTDEQAAQVIRDYLKSEDIHYARATYHLGRGPLLAAYLPIPDPMTYLKMARAVFEKLKGDVHDKLIGTEVHDIYMRLIPDPIQAQGVEYKANAIAEHCQMRINDFSRALMILEMRDGFKEMGLPDIGAEGHHTIGEQAAAIDRILNESLQKLKEA